MPVYAIQSVKHLHTVHQQQMTEASTLQTLETGYKLKGEIKVIYSTDSGMKSI